MVSQKSKTQKQVTILVRAINKVTGSIYFKVRNGENKEYTVALHKSGNTTCTCKHGENAGNHAHCYHVAHCQQAEAARREAEENQRCYREMAFAKMERDIIGWSWQDWLPH